MGRAYLIVLLALSSLVGLSLQWVHSDHTSGLTEEDIEGQVESEDVKEEYVNDDTRGEFNQEDIYGEGSGDIDEDEFEGSGEGEHGRRATEGPVPELSPTTVEMMTTTPIVTTTEPPVTGAINICFCGDSNTQAMMEKHGYNVAEDYFKDLLNITNRAISNLDPHIRVEFLGSQIYNTQIYLLWFNNYDSSDQSLRTANTGFWDTTGNYRAFQGLGCDVAFYTTPEDFTFDFSNMIGLGNTLAMCGVYSHGMIKMFDDMTRTAILLAHELGHVIGCYHDDGTMNPDYQALMDQYPVEVGNILLACELTDVLEGCDDPVGLCVMDPAPYTDHGAPMLYSDCSHAYYDMYLRLAEDFPNWYQTGCFIDDLLDDQMKK